MDPNYDPDEIDEVDALIKDAQEFITQLRRVRAARPRLQRGVQTKNQAPSHPSQPYAEVKQTLLGFAEQMRRLLDIVNPRNGQDAKEHVINLDNLHEAPHAEPRNEPRSDYHKKLHGDEREESREVSQEQEEEQEEEEQEEEEQEEEEQEEEEQEEEEQEEEQDNIDDREALECRQESVQMHLIERKDLGENMVSTFQKIANDPKTVLAGFGLAEISDFEHKPITKTSYTTNVKCHSTHIQLEAPKSANTTGYAYLQPGEGGPFKPVPMNLWASKDMALHELKQVFENMVKEAPGQLLEYYIAPVKLLKGYKSPIHSGPLQDGLRNEISGITTNWLFMSAANNQKPVDFELSPEYPGYYSVLQDGLFEQPIVAYSPPASTRLLGGWMSLQDPRSRIVLYMNWNGAALPILINGLSKEISRDERTKIPMPNREQIRSISPLAHIQDGTYRTPTYLIHGTADDLVPWQQSKRMMDALQEKGVPVHLQLLESEPHLFDMFRRSRRNGPAAAAIIGGINFLRESTGR